MSFLIAGLGNIGPEYMYTRHNVGFMVADALAKDLETNFTLERHAHYAQASFKGKKLHLIKPTTYMNLSGKAINYWMQQLKIEQANLLVIVDELALPFGTLRLKTKGGDAGHNGLTSIQEALQSQQYSRLRFGIGNNFPKGFQVNYVLGNFTSEESKQLPPLFDKCIELVKNFVTIGPERTMNFFNS